MKVWVAAAVAGIVTIALGVSPALAATQASTPGLTSVKVNPWIHARGFLGPIGWFWNQIYFRVFGGSLSDVIVFGGVLFVAPLILVFSMITVLGGTKGAMRKPIVPEGIRTELT